MLKHADTAMYQAKSGAADSVAVYTPAMSSRLRNWLELEASLRHAVEEERLHLVYQPKFRLSDNQLAGVEALLRWCDAEHGEIPPTRFIEIAEDSGLILEHGRLGGARGVPPDAGSGSTAASPCRWPSTCPARSCCTEIRRG